MVRPFVHPATADLNIDAILHALADPVRRSVIVKLLGCSGMSCSGSCDGEDLAPSTISFHHKILRDAGLIRSEKRGVQVWNTVRKADVDARFPGLLDAILQHHASAASA